MPTSTEWRLYFENNKEQLLTIPWHIGAELTSSEKLDIEVSLKEFQAGESSEGHHLLKYARQYSARTGDTEYVEALRLFIAEEQRHARDLARMLALNSIPLVRTTFTDFVFRKLRHLLASLEVSIGVLITAEIIAKVYYPAIGRATSSRILRRLCEQILQDEIKHVEFQAEQLEKLRAGRSRLSMNITLALQRFLLLGTIPVVWQRHGRALRRGGHTLRSFRRECWREFDQAFLPLFQVASLPKLEV